VSLAPRLAVLGPRGTLDLCMPDAGDAIAGVPATGGDPRSALARIAPDVVVALDPERDTLGLLAGVPSESVRVAFVTRERAGSERAGDPRGYARVISAVDGDGAWRELALPVADRLYAPVGPPAVRPRALFVGAGSASRDDYLLALKHDFDLMHAVGGLSIEELESLLARSDAGVVLQERPGSRGAAHMALVHLAAGHLLIADGPTARHGLRPGVDFVEAQAQWQAAHVLATLRATPDAFRSMRLTGRRSAERFRASRAWPRLAADVLADVRAFGRAACAQPAATAGPRAAATP
jgi:hypothetical protein